MLDLIGGGDLIGVTKYLAGEVERLGQAGAAFALLASNTPHIVFDELQRQASIPLLSIVEATRAAAQKLGLRRVGLFGTRFIMQGVYPEVFASRGITVIRVEGDQVHLRGRKGDEHVLQARLGDTAQDSRERWRGHRHIIQGRKKGGETMLTPLGEEILTEYDNRVSSLKSQFDNHWRKPSVTTDGIVFKDGRIVLIRRKNDPFKGSHALPGGFVNHGERLEDCVVREVLEETGLRTQIVRLIGLYSAPGRDPRGHFVTAVYELRPIGGALKAGDDASSAKWVPVEDIPQMAFDHGDIIAAFLAKKKEDGRK